MKERSRIYGTHEELMDRHACTAAFTRSSSWKNSSVRRRKMKLFQTKRDEQDDLNYEGNAVVRMMSYMKPYRGTVAFCFFLVIIITVLELYKPIPDRRRHRQFYHRGTMRLVKWYRNGSLASSGRRQGMWAWLLLLLSATASVCPSAVYRPEDQSMRSATSFSPMWRACPCVSLI